MEDVLSKDKELRDIFQPDDILIADREFRDCLKSLKKKYQINVKIPTCKKDIINNFFMLLLNLLLMLFYLNKKKKTRKKTFDS